MATLSPTDERPRFHFTPAGGWLNDPNGMVYHDGEYHLCYQYHPHSLVWGPMHWGHAVSRDLLTWEHLPVALAPDEEGMIFSGSIVVDRGNTAGFGAGALVAAFTRSGHYFQPQCLAYSLDKGRSWTKYAGNPVLPPPEGVLDFRDPRMFWHPTLEGGHWVMLLAVSQEIWFYTSPDLKTWTRASVFGADHGAHGGVWECPDLVSLPVDGGPERRWALIVSVIQGGPAGGTATQYFVGDFDGSSFSCDDPPETVRWADYGADFYATQTWGGTVDGRTLALAWMNNWDYARETPASTWRGMMSAIRELGLSRTAAGLSLTQRPARELAALRGAAHSAGPLAVKEGTTALEASGDALELVATFRVEGATAARFGLRLRVDAGEATIVGYDRGAGALYVDRSASGQAPPGFAALQAVPLAPADGLIRLHILVDTSSLELFADDGRIAISNQIFPGPGSRGVELFAEGGAVTLEGLTLWELTAMVR